MKPDSQRWLHRYACLTVAATFLLLIAGASVTSNRAGLAVPDWLTAYGEFLLTFPRTKWVGGIFYEHGHRLIAYTVGAMTAILAIRLVPRKQRLWFIAFGALMLLGSLAIKFARPDDTRYLHGVIVGILAIGAGLAFLKQPSTGLGWWGFTALLGVLAQAALGGLTVLKRLPPEISIAHALLAQAFFCILIAIAIFTSRRWRNGGRASPPTNENKTPSPQFRALTLCLTATVFVQLLFGAGIRHAEVGVIPHITLGAAIAVMTIAMCVLSKRDGALQQSSFSVFLLVLAQVVLGVVTYLVRVPKNELGQLDSIQILLPTAHHAVGALILGVVFSIALFSRRPALNTPILQHSDTPPISHSPNLFSAYLELTKPRIVLMVLVTATMGFFLGGNSLQPISLLLTALVGIGLATGGSAVLNNYLERDVDTKMARTRDRALPSGVIEPSNALSFGILLVLAGVVLLVWRVNLLTGFLVLLAAFLYALVYTPMKRLTWLNTSIGAIPGAIPPLCGWAAATGEVGTGAWVLFGILFAWQHPHFYAIAWMFKDDYRAAGFKMLPVVEPSGASTFRQTVLFSALLIGVSLLPTLIGMTGMIYFYGALTMGILFLCVGLLFRAAKSFESARQLLKASVLYLPLLLVLMMVDKI